MTVETQSLWPVDFGEPVQLTPLAILRQQGTALGEQTKNIVVGRVATNGDANMFYHTFSVYCSPLNYQVPLYMVSHGIDLYPATVSLPTGDNKQIAKDPEELKQILKKMFASPETKKIIASLLAQSRQ
jgi:hypothetical protein